MIWVYAPSIITTMQDQSLFQIRRTTRNVFAIKPIAKTMSKPIFSSPPKFLSISKTRSIYFDAITNLFKRKRENNVLNIHLNGLSSLHPQPESPGACAGVRHRFELTS